MWKWIFFIQINPPSQPAPISDFTPILPMNLGRDYSNHNFTICPNPVITQHRGNLDEDLIVWEEDTWDMTIDTS